MVDGIEKKPSEGQGFIYEGTTYVPLIRTLELMTARRKPYARNAGQIQNEPLNQEDLFPAQRPAEQSHQTGQRRVREVRVHALFTFDAFPVHSVYNHKKKNRAKSEHNKRVAV